MPMLRPQARHCCPVPTTLCLQVVSARRATSLSHCRVALLDAKVLAALQAPRSIALTWILKLPAVLNRTDEEVEARRST